MSSKLQLDVRHLNRWWRHLVNAYEVRQAWCLLQVKLCDPCLSALKWFVYHARRYTSARLYFTLHSYLYILVDHMVVTRSCNKCRRQFAITATHATGGRLQRPWTETQLNIWVCVFGNIFGNTAVYRCVTLLSCGRTSRYVLSALNFNSLNYH